MLRRHLRAQVVSRVLCLCLAFPPLAAIAADALLTEAERLLAAKDPRAAYALLLPLEPQRAGEVEYDYLLGIAALDAGDPQRAVFALERVLAMNPQYLQARAEIARAYFVLGEKQNAQREFRTVREQGDIPASAAAAIDKYLSALEPVRARFSGFLEGSYGYDTNVNSATARNEIGIPAFGGAIGVLNQSSVSLRDSFLGSGAGIGLAYDLTSELALIANLSHSGKFNRHWDQFDTLVNEGNAGVRYTTGRAAISVAGQGQSFRLDNSRFRESLGAIAQWQWNVTDTSQVSVYGQFAKLSYPTQSIRDADRTIAGVAMAHAFGGTLSPVMYLSAYGGEEQTRQEYAYLGSFPMGTRIGGQITLAPKVVLFGNAAWERRQYRGDDPIFLTRRLDYQTDYRIGLAYTFHEGWSVIPQVAYTDNRSNIELNAYTRTLTSISLRRDF